MATGTPPPDSGEPKSEETFNDDIRRRLREADTAAAQGGGESNNDDISSQEADGNPEYVNKFTGGDKRRQRAIDIVNGVTTGQGTRGGFLTSRRRRYGVIGFIIALLLGGGGAGFFLGPAVAPIMALTNITDDLNDTVAALQIGNDNLFRAKTLPSEQRNKALKGCRVLSRTCKLATLSARQVAKLKAVSIEVIPSEPNQGSRWVPEKYKFQGVEYDGPGWNEQLRTNPAARNAQLRANNMKYLSLRGPGFDRVLAKFGLSRRAPELRGTAQERVNALMNKADVNDPKNITFTEVITDDGDRVWTLDGDPDGTTYTDAQKASMEKAVTRVNAARAPTNFTKASLGAVSILGYWDMACSVKNMLGAASIAAQVATKADAIKAAVPAAVAIQKIQAGEGTQEDGDAVGRFILSTDSRLQVPSLSNTVNFTNPDTPPSTTDSVALVDNPNYGKNMLDSPLYKLSSSRNMQAMSTTESLFSLGVGQNQLLSGVDGAAQILDDIVNVGTNQIQGDTDACGIVQSGPVRILGGIASVAVAVATFGTSTAIQAGVGVAMMGAMMLLDTIINNALTSGSILNAADIANDPIARMALFWTGMSGAMSEGWQAVGMAPGNSETVAEYQTLKNEVDQRYIAMETENINQFDITNQYSFVGSLATSLVQYTGSSFDLSSALTNTASLVQGGMASLLTSASAASIDPARFKHCDQQSSTAIGIEPDVQCNVRGVMYPEDLKLNLFDVTDYMESTGMIGADSTTGLPEGYTVPDARESQNEVLSFIQGAVDSIVTTNPLPNKYAYWLEYCKYRSMPYGETYEESTAIGDDPEEKAWQTGEKCKERNTEVGYFRMYSLYNEVEDSTSGEEATAAYDDVDTEDALTLYTTPSEKIASPAVDYSALVSAWSTVVGVLRDARNLEKFVPTDAPATPIIARQLSGGLFV